MATAKVSIYYTNTTDKGLRFFWSNRFPSTRAEFSESYGHMMDLPVPFNGETPRDFMITCEAVYSMFRAHTITDELIAAMRVSQIDNNVRHTAMSVGDVVIITTDKGSHAFAVGTFNFIDLTSQIL